MIRSGKWLGLALLAAAPAVALAQENPQSRQNPVITQFGQEVANPGGRQASSAPIGQTSMYEDIEIMRRILSRNVHAHQQAFCASCHQPAWSTDGKTLAWWLHSYTRADARTSSTAAGTAAPNLDVDGTYLKNYGVVFHVTMPAMLGSIQSQPARPVAKTASDWARVRRELHGEKVDKGETAEKAVPDVADILLKSLAHNGHNFSRLGEKENLSIIVSFRPDSDPHTRTRPVFFDALGKVTLEGPGNATTVLQGGSDFEILGDLQVKQGRVQEAIQAYQKGVDAQPDAKRKASLYQKMAQAHLKLEKGDYASAVAKAIDYLKLAQQNANTTAGAPVSVSAPPKLLTAKLILTAPKSLLDAAAKGLGFEEFRRAAHVERVTIPLPEKQGETKR